MKCDEDVIRKVKAIDATKDDSRLLAKSMKGIAQKKAAVDFWRSLSLSTRETIEPCITSDYTMQDQYQEVKTPIFTRDISVRKWLSSWARLMIEWTSPPRRAVFWACRAVVKKDVFVHVTRDLLPHLVENILIYGKEEHVEAVKCEMMAVLSSH